MQDIYEAFEFNRIKEALLPFSLSEFAKDKINNLSILDKETLKMEKEKLKEVNDIISRYQSFPLSVSKNASKILERAKSSGLLTPQDLSNINDDIVQSQEILTYYQKVNGDYPYIDSLIKQISDLSSLSKEIKRCISSSLTILDTASKELKEIREKIKQKEKELEDQVTTMSYKYSSLLSDENVTIRDSHYVLPIKTSYKHKIQGIVYDVSNSKNTTFIEPIEIVELNNDLKSLELEEMGEERKILLNLTNLALLQDKEILSNNKIIGELDFLNAKVKYGQSIDAILLPLSDDKIIDLKGARHPLLDPKKVVSNSFLLNDDNRIIIISGPNAGGKTVSLKTVGLFILMNEVGLMLPLKEGELSYFNNIYVDIGDKQSLSDNLSTYSSHIKNIGEILRVSTKEDFVLIDELGTGTDPKEGEALAISIVSYLLDKEVYSMISSHFSSLKEFAYDKAHITNGSMIFNEEKLSPTYLFKEGIPGKSYAFDVASRYGIDKKILNDARRRVKGSSNDLFEKLTLELKDVSLKKEELEKEKEALKKEKESLVKEKDNLEKRKTNLLEEVREEKEKIISSATDKVNEVLKKLQNDNLKLHDVIEIKKDLDDLKDEAIDIEYHDDIKVGDYVLIPSLNLAGKVEKIKGETAFIISSEGMSIKAALSHLKKEEKPTPIVKKNKIDETISKSYPLEVNLLGLHVEEALTKLDKYLDGARVHHTKTVKIIHGYGTGALRNAVTEYLKKQKDLTFRAGNEYEGSFGVSVVTFND